MEKDDIARIINEELEKMYEDTGILDSYPELKESALKYNRLVEESFDDVKKIYEKTFKYNISNIDNIDSDKKVIEGFRKEFEEIHNTFSGYANQSPLLSDEEKIEVDGMKDNVSKYFRVLTNLSETLKEMLTKFKSLSEELNALRGGSAPLSNVENFKIFIN